MSIDIRPWVLGLASRKEDIGYELVDLANKLEQRIFGEMLQGEFALGSVARILYHMIIIAS